MATLKELKILAKKRNVNGRSWMNKTYLTMQLQKLSGLQCISHALFETIKKGDIVKLWQSNIFAEIAYTYPNSLDVLFYKYSGSSLKDYMDHGQTMVGRKISRLSVAQLDPWFLRAGKKHV